MTRTWSPGRRRCRSIRATRSPVRSPTPKRGSVTVTKTEGGSAELALAWTFQLSGERDRADHEVDGRRQPGRVRQPRPGTYTLCEVDMPIAWHSSLEEPPYNGVADRGRDGHREGVHRARDHGRRGRGVRSRQHDAEHAGRQGGHSVGPPRRSRHVHVRRLQLGQHRVAEHRPCPTTSARTSRTEPVKLNADDDDLLENPGQNGTSSEVWRYTCSYTLPAEHSDDEVNPIVNTVTATGEDIHGNPVSDTDTHETLIIHPAIDIEKTGPATATVGTALAYTLTVTNPGDVAFAAQEVVVTDPKCEAPPAGPNTGTDATPGQLDPGDTWTYTCTAQTTGQPPGTFVNTATVTGKDFLGKTVTDTDDFPTELTQQAVLPQPRSSTARRGCAARAVA